MWIVGEGENKHNASADSLYDWFMYMRKVLADIEGTEIEFNVHSLRHSGLQNLSDGSHYICKKLGMENGFPVEKLRLLANHSDISTTSGYLKDTSVDELENMFGIKIDD